MLQLDFAVVDVLADEMLIDFDVFCASPQNGIRGNGDG